MPADGPRHRKFLTSRRAFLLTAAAISLAGCAANTPEAGTADEVAANAVAAPPTPVVAAAAQAPAPVAPGRDSIVSSFSGRPPNSWGLQLPGTATRLAAGAQGVALTFDCCGGPGGNGVDQALIDVLRHTRTPATFFLNSRWIQANPGTAKSLAEDPLFEIGNHGTRHVPLSVSGRAAYGVPGTSSPAEVYDEIMLNQEALHRLTGTAPRYFRPGTAYFDDVAVAIVRELGLVPVSFSINGDGGATYPMPVVLREVSAAKPGDVIIAHANHPNGGTASGITRALPILRAAGLEPVRLAVT
ncbi:polysaccharide deacetylase family protein [Arthrobacter sp. CC3]|uniref:polysaccharide deacetylase family protein n=1 Tax=Arthrobacter sp. CC3 TaxID=3029185 RepID=UPI003262D905